MSNKVYPGPQDKNAGVFYNRLMDICCPANVELEERSKRTLAVFIGIVSCLVLFGDVVFHFYAGSFLLASVLFLTGVIVMISIFVGRKKKDARFYYRVTMLALGLLFLYLLGTSEAYHNRMFWTYIFPLIALYLLGKNEGLIYTISYYIIAVILVLPQSFGMHFGDYEFRFKLEYLISLLIVSLMAYCFEVIRFKYQEATTRRQGNMETANQQLSQEIEKRILMEQAAKDALMELKETQSQLIQSAKLASIGELASGVAHELNQPLMVIRNTVQLQMRRVKKASELSGDRLEPLAVVETGPEGTVFRMRPPVL